jgi:hypothetical protein
MHADPELLALLALGERAGTDAERQHARTCPLCVGELSELERVVAVGRAPRVELASPSAEVWVRIRAELTLDTAPERPAPPVRYPPVGTAEPLPTEAGDYPGPVRSQDEVTAHARLTPVGAAWSRAFGTATLSTDEHGRRLLQVALRADLPASGVRQAWLVHRDDPSVRQTLGILDGPHGLWTVEHSIDLDQFAILDISQQDTGETEHSGRTIVRGEFALVS